MYFNRVIYKVVLSLTMILAVISGGLAQAVFRIKYSPEIFAPDGEVMDDSVRAFLAQFMAEFRTHLIRVLTVIPRGQEAPPTGA